MRKSTQQPWVIFSHGQESGPVGTKINALAAVASRLGFEWESIDYRGIDDPAARVQKLIESHQPYWNEPILVGSSLGAHVCTAASAHFPTRSLFLMAPAFYMPGYESLTPAPHAAGVTIVHGWWDEVVPVDHSIRYARHHECECHLLRSDHRLNDRLSELEVLFAHHLKTYGQR